MADASYPAVAVDIPVTLVLPADASGPVPVMIMFTWGDRGLAQALGRPAPAGAFAAALIGSSGKGGATLHRRNFGEAVESLTGVGEYHWMAGNYLKYGAAESRSGAMTANDFPVDSHQLLVLCAPRLAFVSYGIPEKGDARWLDQRGSFMAAVAAGPVFRLLGARDLGVGDDRRSARMPPVNVGLLDGRLAWRQHDAGHTDAPNWKQFLAWADRHFGRPHTPAPPVGAAQPAPGR